MRFLTIRLPTNPLSWLCVLGSFFLKNLLIHANKSTNLMRRLLALWCEWKKLTRMKRQVSMLEKFCDESAVVGSVPRACSLRLLKPSPSGSSSGPRWVSSRPAHPSQFTDLSYSLLMGLFAKMTAAPFFMSKWYQAPHRNIPHSGSVFGLQFQECQERCVISISERVWYPN